MIFGIPNNELDFILRMLILGLLSFSCFIVGRVLASKITDEIKEARRWIKVPLFFVFLLSFITFNISKIAFLFLFTLGILLIFLFETKKADFDRFFLVYSGVVILLSSFALQFLGFSFSCIMMLTLGLNSRTKLKRKTSGKEFVLKKSSYFFIPLIVFSIIVLFF